MKLKQLSDVYDGEMKIYVGSYHYLWNMWKGKWIAYDDEPDIPGYTDEQLDELIVESVSVVTYGIIAVYLKGEAA